MNVFRGVYGWMSVALFITSAVAYYTSITPSLLVIMLNPFVFFGLFIVILLLVGVLTAKIKTLSFGSALSILFVYAALNGLILASIFIYYEIGTIALAFVSSAILFFVLTITAYITKSDFEKFTPILFAGLISIIIASLINIFLRSSTFDLIISIVGVVIFMGLTIRDTKKIKSLASSPEFTEDESRKKLGVLGALMLYLDFLNIFLFLLRIFGRRR